MLGAIRIGAVILVVFAGFGAGALGERVRLAGARALFATDITYRKGKDVPLKGIVDEAVAAAPAVERVVILRRTATDIPWTAGRDMEWGAFLDAGRERFEGAQFRKRIDTVDDVDRRNVNEGHAVVELERGVMHARRLFTLELRKDFADVALILARAISLHLIPHHDCSHRSAPR